MPLFVETADGKAHLVCTLSKTSGVVQQPLNIELNSGENVHFHLGEKGSGRVHLTGN